MSDDLSHLQCTDLRRFRNSAMESLGRFLHSFLSPRFPAKEMLAKLDAAVDSVTANAAAEADVSSRPARLQ